MLILFLEWSTKASTASVFFLLPDCCEVVEFCSNFCSEFCNGDLIIVVFQKVFLFCEPELVKCGMVCGVRLS